MRERRSAAARGLHEVERGLEEFRVPGEIGRIFPVDLYPLAGARDAAGGKELMLSRENCSSVAVAAGSRNPMPSPLMQANILSLTK